MLVPVEWILHVQETEEIQDPGVLEEAGVLYSRTRVVSVIKDSFRSLKSPSNVLMNICFHNQTVALKMIGQQSQVAS